MSRWTTRLFEETRQRAAELAIVNNVGQALAEQLELDAMIQRLGDQLREVFAADLVYVALHDAATDMIEFAYYSEHGESSSNAPMRYGEGLTSRILQTRETMLLNRAEAFEETGVPVVGTPRSRTSGCRSSPDATRSASSASRARGRPGGSARPTRGCSPRSPPTSASRSRTPASSRRPAAARARWRR